MKIVSMRSSDLDRVIVVIPEFFGDHGRKWYVVALRPSGRWCSAQLCNSEAEAHKTRRAMLRHHKKLAALYASRKRKT